MPPYGRWYADRFSGCVVQSPYPSRADDQVQGPIRIGYVPLIDCAPLVVAREEGLFAKHGVTVRLCREPGWASIRENLIYRKLDAAQCLAGLVLAIHYGLGCLHQPVVVPLVLNANGNGITLSRHIPPEVLREPGALKRHLAKRPAGRTFTLATVHPYSTHHILLRDWLVREDFRPGLDTQIIFLPPAVLPRNLAAGTIDGFCVGEPWNSRAIMDQTGWCAATSVDLADGHPEKVLAVRKTVHRERRDEIKALTTAVLEGCRHCADPDYRATLTALLSRPEYLDTPEAVIRNCLSNKFHSGHGPARHLPRLHLFFGDEINAPTIDKANWVISGMRQGGLLQGVRLGSLTTLFRTDLYEAALAALRPALTPTPVPCPPTPS